MGLKETLNKLWDDYTLLNPDALKIQNLFLKKEDRVVNDHIAFRTFKHPKTNIEQYSMFFKENGYSPVGEYHFEQKKLFAQHFEHKDKSYPKIFISQLLLEEFSEQLQEKVFRYINQIPLSVIESDEFCVSGKHWDLSYHEYQELKEESEYAAWLSAFGFRANHFTVLINELQNFKSVQEVNNFIKEHGFKLNESGGEIKGSPSDLLEQSSTLAASFQMQFTDKEAFIPSCYYEFALRHPQKNGELYQGFVASSADKIFESTDKAQ